TIKEVGPASPGQPSSGRSAPGSAADGGSSAPGGPVGANPVVGREVAGYEVVLGTVDRAVLRSVQTPQGFAHRVLADAHAAAVDPLTDDAGLVEKAGLPVVCVPGSELALKITRPLDLILAEALLHVP
ncbi:MAG: 2-C-methyl-D-erythritol 4-phosphate cytidylyltransferase, partial [Actinoplanes sp.]